MKLSLRLNVTQGDGRPTGTDPFEYDVLGLPLGEAAQIRNFRGDTGWRVFRMKNDVLGQWGGPYKSADEALIALEDQVNRETPPKKRTSYFRRRGSTFTTSTFSRPRRHRRRAGFAPTS
jgi:hypothetical protein